MNRVTGLARSLVLAGLVTLFVFLPAFMSNQYVLHLLIIAFVYSVVALGVRVVMITGQWTFGQAAFLGIGAYSCELLRTHFGLSFWISMPLAGVFAALFALTIGYPILRPKGIYFSMLTLCLGEVIRTIALEWRSITGGASGMTSIAPPNELSFGPLLSVKFGPTDKIPYYYLALFLLLVTLLVMHRIDKTRLGRSLRSIRQSDSLAAGIGINVARYKVIAFAIGSFFSGISGAFMPTYLGTVYPDHFNVWQSIYPVVHVTVGGLEHLFGPVVGTLFVTFIFEITRASPELQQLLYALILIVVIMLLPKGLTSLASQSLVWSAYIKRHLGGKNFGTA